MPAVAGYSGTVTWTHGGGDIDLNVRSWSLDYVADTLDTTDFTSTGDRTFIGGLRSWSGTFENLLDGATAPIGQGSDIGTSTSIILDDAGSGGTRYSGTAICTGIHPSVTVDGVNTITVDFQGTGALTIANIA